MAPGSLLLEMTSFLTSGFKLWVYNQGSFKKFRLWIPAIGLWLSKTYYTNFLFRELPAYQVQTPQDIMYYSILLFRELPAYQVQTPEDIMYYSILLFRELPAYQVQTPQDIMYYSILLFRELPAYQVQTPEELIQENIRICALISE